MNVKLQGQIKDLASKWIHNQQGLGFSYSVKTDDKKHLVYSVQGCPDQYQESLEKLLNSLLRAGISYICEEFSFPVSEKYIDRIKAYIDKKATSFLDMLLKNECDAFFREVVDAAKITEFSLVASTIHDDNGSWKNWREESLNLRNGSWVMPDGTARSDAVSAALWSVVAKANKELKSL